MPALHQPRFNIHDHKDLDPNDILEHQGHNVHSIPIANPQQWLPNRRRMSLPGTKLHHGDQDNLHRDALQANPPCRRLQDGDCHSHSRQRPNDLHRRHAHATTIPLPELKQERGTVPDWQLSGLQQLVQSCAVSQQQQRNPIPQQQQQQQQRDSVPKQLFWPRAIFQQQHGTISQQQCRSLP